MPNIWFNIFDDELLYSAIARAQHYSALPTLTIQEIFFGNGKAQPKFLIPTNLEYFCNEFDYSPEYILSKHSVYNYFAPFASKESKEKAFKQFMTSDNKYNPGKTLGLIETNSDRITMNYCQACAIEDFNMIGVPYFHVSHNLNGIKVCHKHGRSLIPLSSTLDGNYKMIGIEEVCPSLVVPQVEHHKKIAQLAFELINSDVSNLNRERVSNKMRKLLKMHGLVKLNGKIDQVGLARNVKEFYGIDFLNETGNVIIDTSNCWTRRVTSSWGNLVRPMQYLLIINMFSCSISEFLLMDARVEDNDIQKVTKEVKANKKLLLSHKRRLLTAKRWHPKWLRNDYRKNCHNAYQYVEKYDRKFIDKFLPKPNSKPTKAYHKRQYDEQEDKYYLSLIQQEHLKLLERVPVIKITKFTLEKAIGRPNMFQHGNFILCKNYIMSVSESTYDVRLRLCKMIVDRYIDIGVKPTLQQIRKDSKFKEIKRFGPLIEEIERYIEESINKENL